MCSLVTLCNIETKTQSNLLVKHNITVTYKVDGVKLYYDKMLVGFSWLSVGNLLGVSGHVSVSSKSD